MVEMLRLATRLKFPSKSISTRPVIVRLGEGSTHSKLLPIRKNRAFTWNSGAASGPVSTRNIGSNFEWVDPDRQSTRLNSSHVRISYAVFCLNKNHKAQLDAVVD